MRTRTRRPTLPGEILKELYLIPRGVSIAAFARAVGCSRKHMSNVINGNARIEASLATRIAAVLDTTPALWLNLQNAVDIYDTERELKKWKPRQVYHVSEAAVNSNA